VHAGLVPSLVRLDSGNRFALSKKVRNILDGAGLKDTKIFVSGDLNELIIDDLTSRKAPIDSFGVGTELVTSRDDPALSGIYKLVSVEKNGEPIYRVKTSEGKRTIPGAKQIYRRCSKWNGKFLGDVLALANEDAPNGTVPLLIEVCRKGKCIYDLPDILAIQGHAKEEIARLPAKYKRLKGSVEPPVRLSSKLKQLTNSLWKLHDRS
jgi:nicotinate phosphoribosyltransferase